MTVPVAMMVCFPMLMEVMAWGFPAAAFGSEVFVLVKSPRRWTSAIITVLPPSVMLAVPEMFARRETLLPLSCENVRNRGV